MSYCWIIPHYNHAFEFRTFLLTRLLESGLPAIVVDDGSDPVNFEQMETVTAGHSSITLLRLGENRGKGVAVLAGCKHARQSGFTHILQIDADGQHEPADAPRFIEASRANPTAIISGYPIFDESVPKVRKYGRKITTFWVMIETFSREIKDALCGYRVYPLNTVEHLVEHSSVGDRMNFDTEIIVKSVWHNFPVVFIDTRVRYIQGGTSHFHYVQDNLNLIKLHAGMVLQSLKFMPGLLLRRLRK